MVDRPGDRGADRRSLEPAYRANRRSLVQYPFTPAATDSEQHFRKEILRGATPLQRLDFAAHAPGQSFQ
jgi:hypothetical protein